MPANTPNRNYPYPVDTDLIDVAGDVEDLALALDTDFDAVLAQVENKVSVSGDTMTGMLTLPGTNPTSLNHAVRKGWADTTYLNKTGDAMSGDLDMNQNNIIGLGPPTGDNMAARKIYVDNTFADAVSKTSTAENQYMVSGLKADHFVVTNTDISANPPGPYHCVTKQYVDNKISGSGLDRDEADTRYVNANGDSMTGPLNIPSSPIVLGGEWDQSQPSLRLQSDGKVKSTVSEVGASVVLNRAGAANAGGDVGPPAVEGQHYIDFTFSVDQLHGSITIQPDGSGVHYNETSDARLKERLGPITDSARRVQQLAARAFNGRWIGGQQSRDMLTAQDIGEVAPYAVSGGSDVRTDPMMVSYGELVPLLVSALGAALNRIDRLEAGLA